MAKKKPAKKNDQAELPLDAAASDQQSAVSAQPAAKPARGKKQKPTPPAEGTPIGDSSAVLVPKPVAGVADPGSETPGSATPATSEPPPPKRPKGQKVQ